MVGSKLCTRRHNAWTLNIVLYTFGFIWWGVIPSRLIHSCTKGDNGSRTPCFSICAHKVTHPRRGVLGFSSPVGTLSITLFSMAYYALNRSNFCWVMLLGCSSADHPCSSSFFSECDSAHSPDPSLATDALPCSPRSLPSPL